MRSRWSQIVTVEEPSPVQESFLGSTNEGFPRIERGTEGFKKVLAECKEYIGLDLEFSQAKKPTVLGISSETSCSSIPWSTEAAKWVYDTGAKLVGHAVISADKPVFDEAVGVYTDLNRWEDSLITHALINADFSKAPGKDEDSDDSTTMGLMNLWVMASLCTTHPNHKVCRGKKCSGPCPRHDVFGYCAVDSYDGLIGYLHNKKLMKERGIPARLYERLKNLSFISVEMEARGVKVDLNYIRELEEQFNASKSKLFPDKGSVPDVLPLFGDTGDSQPSDDISTPFNPRSPKQVQEYFGSHGITLESTDKKEVQEVLERQAHKLKCRGIEELEVLESLPRPVENLLKLYQYKTLGKGLKSWFDESYIKSGFVYPRWIFVGATSTGRASSAKPNFMNIPARGFGAGVRRVIIPRSPKLKILKADASQLELRVCLRAAGAKTKLGGDAFSDLAAASGGKFERAAKAHNMTARDIAKSVSHAGDYLEGLNILTFEDLHRESIQREIKAGARLVFPDWEYGGGVVSFTGSNLSARLFGDKSHAHRKEALEIQELYFETVPEIRPWQKLVSKQIEARGYVQSETGRYLELYGSPEENLKDACAFIGQGQGADFMLEKLQKYYDKDKTLATLFVHDEFVWEIPESWGIQAITKFTEILREPSEVLSGFTCPFKCKLGPNWGDTNAISF